MRGIIKRKQTTVHTMPSRTSRMEIGKARWMRRRSAKQKTVQDHTRMRNLSNIMATSLSSSGIRQLRRRHLRGSARNVAVAERRVYGHFGPRAPRVLELVTLTRRERRKKRKRRMK